MTCKRAICNPVTELVLFFNLFTGVKATRGAREYPARRDAAPPVRVLRARAVRARRARRASYRARDILHQKNR